MLLLGSQFIIIEKSGRASRSRVQFLRIHHQAMSGQKLIKTPNTLNIIHTFENRQEFQQVQFCFPLCVVED
jgi:hypothetical protein